MIAKTSVGFSGIQIPRILIEEIDLSINTSGR